MSGGARRMFRYVVSARIAVAAVLVIAGSLAVLWAGTGTGEPAGMVRVLVMAAAVAAVVLALSALLPRPDQPREGKNS